MFIIYAGQNWYISLEVQKVCFAACLINLEVYSID